MATMAIMVLHLGQALRVKGGAEEEREGNPGDCWVMEAREQGFRFEKVGESVALTVED